MKFLEVGSAMQIRGGDGHEIHVFGHEFGQFMTIVLGPGVAKCLRQIAQGVLVLLGLSAGEGSRGNRKKQQEAARKIFHGSFTPFVKCRGPAMRYVGGDSYIATN